VLFRSAALTIVAAVRVASTHRVFNVTIDEPLHLAGGWQWLGGDYTIDISHPPLARVLAALPLRFAALPDPPPGSDVEQGNAILYAGGRYVKNLARARMGNLLLLIAGILAVAALARRAFGEVVSVIATALYTNLPPLLAHAGLVTTDMAVTAALALAILALDRFLESPDRERAILLGAAMALGVLGKFSFIVYFPAAAIVLIAVRWRVQTRVRAVALAIGVAFLLIWAGYQFRIGTMGSVFRTATFFVEQAAPEPLRPAARWVALHVPVPAPALPVGMALLKMHDNQGHEAFLLGERSAEGWWYYFPVVVFFKTPLPFLALAIGGIALALRRRIAVEHALMPIAILLVGMTGSINIGVRHVLPMYASLAIVAAYATVQLWRATTRRPFARLAFAALMLWLFLGPAAAHPDYLAWFNEAAGKNPARIAVDSNLDWGQDVLRLERAARELKIDKVWIAYSTSAFFEHHDLRADGMPPGRVSGWIAAGETPLAMNPRDYQWLTRYEPVRRIGKSMRLYYVPQ
jgi:4-amino-4-deoxy-L-arabinose transferase-like glycosyltransferase